MTEQIEFKITMNKNDFEDVFGNEQKFKEFVITHFGDFTKVVNMEDYKTNLEMLNDITSFKSFSGDDMAKILSRFVNSFITPIKEFTETIMNEHRTLQQNIFRLFLETIKKWSELERYDLRNEYTIETSKKIMEILENNSHVPLV